MEREKALFAFARPRLFPFSEVEEEDDPCCDCSCQYLRHSRGNIIRARLITHWR